MCIVLVFVHGRGTGITTQLRLWKGDKEIKERDETYLPELHCDVDSAVYQKRTLPI
jgi:hypothetical protein